MPPILKDQVVTLALYSSWSLGCESGQEPAIRPRALTLAPSYCCSDRHSERPGQWYAMMVRDRAEVPASPMPRYKMGTRPSFQRESSVA